MAKWRHLQIIDETNPQNPNDGTPYVLYNPNEGIDKIWIFMGVKWLLEEGFWDTSKKWSESGIWHFYNSVF